MSNINKQALRMSMQRVSEISKGSTLIVGEKERLANTALYLADELNTATSAFQAAGFAQLDAEEKLEAANAKVLALLDELEAKDAKIANLTAERDALREGEMGDAKHSNTRAAADIYFQLVEECEIPAGGSLVEYVSQLRECSAAGKGEAS